MYSLIITFPLLGFLVTVLFGSRMGKKGAPLLTIGSMFFCFLTSLFIFYEVCLCQAPCYIDGTDWVNSDLFEIRWGFMFDTLTSTMLVVVTSVSFLVHLYASEYMSADPHLPRFMSYLSLFTFFMIILVSGDNFMQLFVGWEGVGLCSYLLINFWFLRLQANKSAMKAMIVNRVGDLGLCIGIFFIFLLTGCLDFSSLFGSSIHWMNETIYFFGHDSHAFTVICLFLFVGSVGKSAQIGLHTWLPDAMEGPTPVSALIHAATMVTAGVFLILRCSLLFELTSTALLVLTFVGSMTSFFAATIGVFQNDLKKVIAYSTCSQLGYMVFACGISNYQVSIYHLANHAFFKALLFLSAGSIIHSVADEQDMRRMGGYVQLLPYSYTMILIGSFALMGVPFLTGFYSKDFILESAFASYTLSGHFAFWLGSISACLTSFYSIRLVYLTFLNKTNSPRVVFDHIHDAPIRMALPLGLLALASIFIGYLWRDMFLGGATHFWGNSFFVSPSSLDLLDAEFIPLSIKWIPLLFSLTGTMSAYILYGFFQKFLFQIKVSSFGRSVYSFFNARWYFDHVYNSYIGVKLLNIGSVVTFQLLDKGFIEMFGPRGISKSIKYISTKVSSLQTGWIHHSVFIMMLGISFLLAVLSFWNFLDDRTYLVALIISFILFSFFI